MTGKIGIGVFEESRRVLESIERYPDPDRVICYTFPGVIDDFSGFHVDVSGHPAARMIGDLASGNIAAAVRGTLPANETLQELKRVFNTRELERIVLLETGDNIRFFLAPVGVDEGWTVAQKISLVEKGRIIASRFGLPDKVGILSGGRLGDIGRHEIVDRTMADAELVSHITGACHYEIRIEDAIRECGLIIAPDGISGNLIFRTLTFAGMGAAHGAPVVNIEKIFVDTSRVNPDYTNALILAASLSG